MKAVFIHVCLFAFLASGPLLGQYQMRFPNSYYLPDNWPAYSLKMTREGTLRELFEAGLRPGYTGVADKIRQIKLDTHFTHRGQNRSRCVSGHPKCTTNGHFEEAQSAPPLDVI